MRYVIIFDGICSNYAERGKDNESPHKSIEPRFNDKLPQHDSLQQTDYSTLLSHRSGEHHDPGRHDEGESQHWQPGTVAVRPSPHREERAERNDEKHCEYGTDDANGHTAWERHLN